MKKNKLKFMFTLSYLEIIQKIQGMNLRHSSESFKQLFTMVFNSTPKTHLSSLGVNSQNKRLILDKLETKFKIRIRKTNGEELITVQDLLTAVFMQVNKNI